MSENATKKDLADLQLSLEKSIGDAVTDLSEIIAGLAQSMHDEIVYLHDENRKIRESLDRLTNTIDGFVGRIDNYETEMAARDHQFKKLLSWARKVSEKTGIPIENL